MSATAQFERRILARCCIDPDFRAKAKDVLDHGGAFGDQTLVWIWRTICRLPRNDKISRSSMMTLVELAFKEDRVKEESHVNAVDAVFELTSSLDLNAVDIQVIAKLASHARLETAVVETAKLLAKGDVEEAWDRIHQVKRTSGKKSIRRIDYAKSIPERVSAMKAQEGPTFTYIPTRLKGLDKYIDGLRLSELGIIAATTNKGKSITAMNFAAASALQGFVTVIFSTEMLLEQVAMRFDSLLTKSEHRKFKTWGFNNEEEEKLAEMFEIRMEQLYGKLFIFDAPIRECKLQTIENAILELEDEIGEQVQMCVIDSPAHFKSEHKYDQKRLEAADIYWDIKAVARGEGVVEHPMAIWVTDQAGKEYEFKLAGASSTSESYDKSRICDVMITINQTPEQEVNNEMIMNLAKVRDAPARSQLRLRSLFQIMTFEELGEVDLRHGDLVHDMTAAA